MTKQLDHIVVITPGFAKDEQDTTCIPTIQVYLKALQTSHPDLHISVLTLAFPERKQVYQWNGISVFPCFSGSGLSGRLKRWFYAYRTLKRLHRQNPISLVHSLWLTEATLVGALAKRKWTIPLITTLMGQDAKSSNRYLRYLKSAPNQIVAISQNQAALISKSGRQADRVIPWGVEPLLQEALPLKWDIVGAGNLIPLKNYRLFVELIEQLKHDFPQIKTAIIGEGVEGQQLRDLIREKGLEQQVQLLGKLDRSRVLEHLHQSHIFLHPSTYEGQGYVFYEALQAGCQLVSFDVGAAEASATWRLATDPQEMLAILQKILKKTPLRSEGPLPTRFLIEDTLRHYQKLYQEVLRED